MSQQGLPVSNLIEVQVNLSPAGAQALNQSTCMIIGDTDVINTSQRYRLYNSISEVAGDFGNTVPEYLAASLWFGQIPQPTELYIGRWAQSATHGRLVCGALTTAEQAITAWNTIANGSFTVTVDGGASTNITGLNFTSDTNLNAVASTISTALTTASLPLSCVWTQDSTGGYFQFVTTGTGTNKTVSFLGAEGTGTDVSAQLAGTAATGAVEVAGIVAESALTSVEIIEGLVQFYGLTFATGNNNTDIVTADHVAIAAYIDADSTPHIYGVSSQDPNCLVALATSDVAYALSHAKYNRSFVQFSSSNPFCAASYLGRLLTVDLTQNNSAITMMYKQEPGIVGENLTASQNAGAQAKNCNVYANYNNDTSLIQYGTQASGVYTDTIFDVDYLVSSIQTNVFNLLYETTTKIPQTDAGNHQIATEISASCAQSVDNGSLGPGIWTSGGFGTLQQGQNLPNGYYVYQPPISTQSAGARAARKSVPFQVAAKLAGAIHEVMITVTVDQ